MGGVLSEQLRELLKHPSRIEPWLFEGCTILIPKGSCQGKPQYRPITCLYVMYKLFAAIVMELLYGHSVEVGAIPKSRGR